MEAKTGSVESGYRVGRFFVIPIDEPIPQELCSQPAQPNHGVFTIESLAVGPTPQELCNQSAQPNHEVFIFEPLVLEHLNRSLCHKCRSICRKFMLYLLYGVLTLAYFGMLVLSWSNYIDNTSNIKGMLQLISILAPLLVVYLIYAYCKRGREDDE